MLLQRNKWDAIKMIWDNFALDIMISHFWDIWEAKMVGNGNSRRILI